MGLAFGIVAGAFEAKTSGKGQVVDAAVLDLVAMMGSIAHWIHASGQLGGKHPSSFYDSPFYDIFECADGQWISIGPLEPQFYATLLAKLELGDVSPKAQYDSAQWPALKGRLTALFKSQPRAHWTRLLEGTDACFAPVLTPKGAAGHPHNVARKVFADGPVLQANPAPRFSRTPAAIQPVDAGGTAPALANINPARLDALRAAGVIA